MHNGKFVISLDFELHWGFFDNRSLDDSKEQLVNVASVIDQLLDLCDTYQIRITFATVGFLFAENKKKVQSFLPNQKPKYENQSVNAYKLLEAIDSDEEPYYFAQHLIKRIKDNPLHEIGTHTFSHYYCHEKGQTIAEFKEDIQSAISIGESLGINTRSIVFPRNQSLPEYIKVCEELGITSYRGNCWFNFNNDSRQIQLKEYAMKFCRVFDSYINISGKNSYDLKEYNTEGNQIINIPASRFLRPYNTRLKTFESLKINRIKHAMTTAAIRNEVYHLWFHPHNFANNTSENFKNLEAIFKHYKHLKTVYDFESITMTELTNSFKVN